MMYSTVLQTSCHLVQAQICKIELYTDVMLIYISNKYLQSLLVANVRNECYGVGYNRF